MCRSAGHLGVNGFLGDCRGTSGDPVTVIPARLRMTFERVNLPEDEKMGLMGGSFLYDANDWLSIGPAAYGAITGDRGGFITLGLAGDLRMPLADRIDLDGGLFVGAGGGRGGYTLQGGGLMVRSHLGVTLKSTDWGNLGAGASYVDFPNGSIHSLQPYIAYEYPFRTLLTHGWPELDIDNTGNLDLPVSVQEFSLVYRDYRIPDGVKTDSGDTQHPTIQLLGAEWQHYLDRRLFLKIESEGAMGGQSNGYMQILLGGGYRLRAGVYHRAEIIRFRRRGRRRQGCNRRRPAARWFGFYPAEYLRFPLSRTGWRLCEIPRPHFRAASYTAKVGYRYGTPDIDRSTVMVSDLDGFVQKKMRLRFVQQTYLEDAPTGEIIMPT